MKIVYSILLIIIIFISGVIYFTNLMNTSNQYLFLGSVNSTISVGGGLFLMFFLGILFGVFSLLFLQVLIKSKPKDFDEYDL